VRATARRALTAVTLASVAYLAAYIFIAVRRITYPFDLEWMEGASVDTVARILAGHQIYVRPNLSFIPSIYPPLYFYLSAASAWFFGISRFSLRLVSFASSLVTLGLLFEIVRRDSGSSEAGLLGMGLFAATYRLGGAWFDLARVDSLFLMLTVAGLYLLRCRESRGGWIAAGLCFALAALTKQTAAVIALPMCAYAVIRNQRLALLPLASFALVLGGATLALNARTHGWFLYFDVELPWRLQQLHDVPAAIWRDHLFGPVLLLMCGAAAAVLALAFIDGDAALFLGLVMVACVGGAWTSSRHSGAYDNVFMPAYLGPSLVVAVATGRLSVARARWSPVLLAATIVCAVQLWWLRYPVLAQIPTAADFATAASFEASVADVPGPVFVPQHGFVASAAGKPMMAHDWSTFDVLRLSDRADAAELSHEFHAAFEGHRFAAVALDKPETWFADDLERYYRRDRPALGSATLWTKTGYRTEPRWIYVPR
jgi:4-amino-4-deoxy-L-arabinose transferase-like glycosyltransferase